MTPLLLAMALVAPGCPAAQARARALADADLAPRAVALVEVLGPRGLASLGAIQAEAQRAARAGPAGSAARAGAGARFRAALDRHCALAAQPPLPPAGAAARARAAAILDEPAFRAARADRQAARRVLWGLWHRLLALLETGEAQEYASFSRAVFLGAAAVAGALGILAAVRRRARRDPAGAAATPAPRRLAPGERLGAAEAAAARGDAAAAVRLALLAALAGLERRGAVPAGRAFTNGELLALLQGGPPARQDAARTLARLFDRTVYGGVPAGPGEAAAALDAARALGTELG